MSIILPMFNAESTIERALRSCLDQTMPDFEAIVIDDGSTDKSLQIVKNINDPRIRFLPQAVNLGPADARNLALDHARGKWITFLDADDYYLPTRLEQLLAAAEGEPPYTAVVDHFAVRKPKTSLTKQVYTVEQLIPLSVHGQIMFERSHIDVARARFPCGVRNGEDTAFMLQVMSVPGSRLIRIPDRLYWYTLTKGSLTSRKTKFLDHVNAYQSVLDHPAINGTVRAQILEAIRPLPLEHAYESFQMFIKRGRLLRALYILRTHPEVWRLALRRTPVALRYRWNHWVLRKGRI